MKTRFLLFVVFAILLFPVTAKSFGEYDSASLELNDETEHESPAGNIGELYWKEAAYSGKENSAATLRLVDPDLALPDSANYVRIHVHSDTDSLGTDIILTNTHENPDFFEGKVIFTHSFHSSRGVLLVSDGDTIFAKYSDTTLPDDADSDTHEVIATAIIIGPRGPIERVPATSLRIEDLKQNVFSDNIVPVGHQVLFSAELNAQTQETHNFAYLVQIQDSEGRTMSLSWLSGIILPEQTITTSQSWIPDLLGTYFVTVFVWESVDNPTALSPPLSVEFIVE